MCMLLINNLHCVAVKLTSMYTEEWDARIMYCNITMKRLWWCRSQTTARPPDKKSWRKTWTLCWSYIVQLVATSKQKKKTLHSVTAWELVLFWSFETVSIPPMSAGSLNSQHLNQLCQCSSSPGYRAYCHAELAISSLVVARRPWPLAITHSAYPWRDG